MQNSIYKIKYLLFLSWDWEAWCLTVWGVIPPPPERNTAWNKGRKCFHCLGAPNDLIRPWLYLYTTSGRSWPVIGWPLPLQRPDTYFTGGWVGPRAGLNGCRKSRSPSPHRDSIPGPSSPQSVAIPNTLSRPTLNHTTSEEYYFIKYLSCASAAMTSLLWGLC